MCERSLQRPESDYLQNRVIVTDIKGCQEIVLSDILNTLKLMYPTINLLCDGNQADFYGRSGILGKVHKPEVNANTCLSRGLEKGKATTFYLRIQTVQAKS